MPPESPYRIEPCLLSEIPASLADVLADVVRAAAMLGARLHPASASSLAELVRVMNCYYSNLIEGHNTRPRDIERALADDLDNDTERRDLQLEARAHIRVQRELDARFQDGTLGEPAAVALIRHLHRAFYEGAPPSMLRMEREAGDFDMVPGEFRSLPLHDVMVGRHQPPSSAHVASFMDYFADRYRLEKLGTTSRLVAMAAAHHRFNYIHPFADGNGRVSRLMSHAMALAAGIGAHGLWSISRGLARGLGDAGEYKRMMDAADAPRENDLDGRGNLSQSALLEFVEWFARVALDQLTFMTRMFDLDALGGRLERHVRIDLGGSDAAVALAREVLRAGEMPRGRAAAVTGRPERTARTALASLLDAGLFTSESPKSAVRLVFSTSNADTLFPRLFAAQLA